MPSKLALKRLTDSDLTFFKWHFDNHPAGNQKAINLNKNILIDQFYPSLPKIIHQMQGSITLDLYLYGPGKAGEYNVPRKIQRTRSYKNYRLNGITIPDPDTDTDRYHQLQRDDFVLINFEGNVKPESAMAIFVSQAHPEDKRLHDTLKNYIAGKSMISIRYSELGALISQANATADHPVNLLLQEELIEDAVYGGIEAIKALRKGPSKGKISRKDLENAKRNAESTGRMGEEFVAGYLNGLQAQNKIKDFTWESDENAIAPYDFEIVQSDDSKAFIDVKSTKGNFANNIHISFNELLQIREGKPYYIYRVFDIEEINASLKIARIEADFAQNIIGVLESLPPGVSTTGISLKPDTLAFGNDVVTLTIPEDEE